MYSIEEVKHYYEHSWKDIRTIYIFKTEFELVSSNWQSKQKINRSANYIYTKNLIISLWATDFADNDLLMVKIKCNKKWNSPYLLDIRDFTKIPTMEDHRVLQHS